MFKIGWTLLRTSSNTSNNDSHQHIEYFMKLSLKFISILVLLFAAASAFPQTVNPAKLKINGIIGLDSTYAQMIQAFGKPAHETKPQHEECTGGNEKTVKYAGLEFYFM